MLASARDFGLSTFVRLPTNRRAMPVVACATKGSGAACTSFLIFFVVARLPMH